MLLHTQSPAWSTGSRIWRVLYGLARLSDSRSEVGQLGWRERLGPLAHVRWRARYGHVALLLLLLLLLLITHGTAAVAGRALGPPGTNAARVLLCCCCFWAGSGAAWYGRCACMNFLHW